jgi:multiple sugar transport system permease protein
MAARMKDKHIVIPFLAPALLITFFFILIPLFMAIRLSFYQMESYVSAPKWAGLGNYVRIFQDPAFWNAFVNGLVYSLLSIALQVVLGIAFAIVLNQVFKGKSFVRGVSILPYILPTVVVALTWQWMLDGRIGILTNAASMLGLGQINWLETPRMAMFTVILVSVWTWTPFVTTCFLAALQTVPLDLLDAAEVDGTSAWQRFIYITIPVLKPILVIIVLLRGIWMFNKFDIIWLLTKGGPLNATEHLPILTYQKAFQTYDIGGGTAVATVSFLFLVVVVLIYLKVFRMED